MRKSYDNVNMKHISSQPAANSGAAADSLDSQKRKQNSGQYTEERNSSKKAPR